MKNHGINFLAGLAVALGAGNLSAEEPAALAQVQALAAAQRIAPQAPQAVSAAGPVKPAYKPEALARIVERVKTFVAAKRSPVVVFDMDDTLFDSSDRDVRILKELSKDEKFVEQFPAEAAQLAKVRVEDCRGRYNILESAGALGVTDKAALDAVKAYWSARFFSDEYVRIDPPTPGAAKYVHAVVKAGATVFYITGRSNQDMRKGTEESLKKHGFPMPNGESVVLLMKDDKSEKDAAYKDRVLGEIVDQKGEVMASFENEPKNLNVFGKRYPNCDLVFLDTKHSSAPDTPDSSAAWVKDFGK